MDCDKVCFLSRVKDTWLVNFAPRQINLTPRQITLLFSVLPSSLTVHTIPEFPKRPIFMIGQRWKHIVAEGRGGESGNRIFMIGLFLARWSSWTTTTWEPYSRSFVSTILEDQSSLMLRWSNMLKIFRKVWSGPGTTKRSGHFCTHHMMTLI